MSNQKQINLLSTGADIEVFLRDKKTNEVVSAEGIIKGSKYEPFQFDANDPYASTSLDNILCEFTCRPSKTAKEFVNAINKSMSYIKSILPKNLDILITPSANLDEKWLQTENAQLFGCENDFNAYTRSINNKPCAEDLTLRSAGGHIHLGYNDIEVPFDGCLDMYNADEQRSEIIKALDLFIGVPLTIIEPDNKRKELYGKAGAFRPKPYGLEYRTPSNIYLLNDDLKKWIFNSAKSAIDFINKNGYLENDLANYVCQTINDNDRRSAVELVKEFNLVMA